MWGEIPHNNKRKRGKQMTKKTEIMKDLKFCQELMDRLVEFVDKNCIEHAYYLEKHTVVQNDIIKLRRELSEVRKKLEE
jgi:hypothetical protein